MTTPEYQTLLAFARHRAASGLDWAAAVPHASTDVARIAAGDGAALRRCLGAGRPAVVVGAAAGARAARAWTPGFFAARHGGARVAANDRAPARHADAAPGGRPQRTLRTSLRGYIRDHVLALPATLEALAADPVLGGASAAPPFYLNGWRAFADAPELAADAPAPGAAGFAAAVDDTAALLAAVDAALFKGAAGGGGDAPSQGGGGGGGWCAAVDASLCKLFIGPPGTVTRLHVDAGGAHGWLCQLQGRKLFVLLPPGAEAALAPLPSERETRQSAVDPLDPAAAACGNPSPHAAGGGAPPFSPAAYAAAGAAACVVGPGDAVVVPAGWWHYAAALDRSVTLQRNFYSAGAGGNAAGLVAMVASTARALRAARPA